MLSGVGHNFQFILFGFQTNVRVGYIYRENNYYEKIVVTSVQNVGLQQPKSLTVSK